MIKKKTGTLLIYENLVYFFKIFSLFEGVSDERIKIITKKIGNLNEARMFTYKSLILVAKEITHAAAQGVHEYVWHVK